MPELFIAAGILLAVLVAAAVMLLSLRGTLTVAYDGELTVSFKTLFFKIMLYPQKPRKKRKRQSMSARKAARIRKAARRRAEKERLAREKKLQKKRAAKKTRKTNDKAAEKKSLSQKATQVVDILAVITETVAVIVKRFTHHLRVKVARLRVKVASEDAALTAVTYGAVTQVINVLLPILSTVSHFKLPDKKQFDVSADFSSTTPEIEAEISFSLRVWHLADIGVRGLLGGIVKYVKRTDNLEDTLSGVINKSLGALEVNKANKENN